MASLELVFLRKRERMKNLQKRIRELKLLEAPLIYQKRSSEESLHKYRTEFQRDRDRILYSRAFRRLNGKTQVFLPLAHDHLRNRLTHTLEVAQIASVTVRYLGLNEELTEGISLGHDLGHTPFGHVGERALNLIMNGCEEIPPAQQHLQEETMGFKLNLQSVRVCCDLEKIYPEFPGLNLTNFTMWGVKIHSKSIWGPCEYLNEGECSLGLIPKCCRKQNGLSVRFYSPYDKRTLVENHNSEAWSFEAFVVALADEIAQRHHDIEDACHVGILDREDITGKMNEIFGGILKREDRSNFAKLDENGKGYFIPVASRFLVNFYNKDLITNSKQNMKKLVSKYQIKNKEDFKIAYLYMKPEEYREIVGFSPELSEADKAFKKFIKDAVLNSFYVQRMDGKGLYVIRRLFKAYLTNPKQLHDPTIVFLNNLFEGKREHVLDISKNRIGELRENIGRAALRQDPEFQAALLRTICDHIAGMTDNFILSEYSRLYGSEPDVFY
jgi:dGTPase